MTHEIGPRQINQVPEMEVLTQRSAENISPIRILGNLAVGYLIGGAIAGNVMPLTEQVTLEGLAATTQYGNNLAEEDNLIHSA